MDPCHGRWAAWLDALWGDDVRDVLDVCCGTGLLAAELTARGHRVTGVDASPAMLARARQLLGPEARLVRAVLPDLGVDGTYDAAVCTFDGLNYLAPADLEPTFRALRKRLRPGGWLVFDVHTDAMMAFTLDQPEVAGESVGHRFTISSEVDPDARTCVTSIELHPPEGASFSERHRQWFHSESALREALAGFSVVGVVDEYSDEPARASTLRATWIARRS